MPATRLPACSYFHALFLTHNSDTQPAHILYILTFPAASFAVKSDKQGIEGGEMLLFPPLKFSLVQSPT